MVLMYHNYDLLIICLSHRLSIDLRSKGLDKIRSHHGLEKK